MRAVTVEIGVKDAVELKDVPETPRKTVRFWSRP
jgi:hypothetical protein